ncbi:MAG: hypothetical protein MPK62_00485 [Alphaproteobacteria bacterium]|nr:hypothetical protein [Alphaproteobacteria bacterium]MDA8029615.1 hypothetical protein [Alphaproteobacteria bacterium]
MTRIASVAGIYDVRFDDDPRWTGCIRAAALLRLEQRILTTDVRMDSFRLMLGPTDRNGNISLNILYLDGDSWRLCYHTKVY